MSSWFTDEDGDPLSYSVVSAVDSSEGTVSSSVYSVSDDTIIYTPTVEHASKTVTFIIKANDGQADSASNVTINVAVGTAPADDGTQIAITDNKGLSGVDIDADVEYTMTGYNYNIKVPNGINSVTLSFTPEANCLVGTSTTLTGSIAASKITSIPSVTIPIRDEGSTYTIYSFNQKLGTNYRLGATYTFTFSYYFYVTNAVGNQRVVYDQGATAAALSVGAYAPGSAVITYQWQQSSDGVNYTDIPGNTETTFTPPTDVAGSKLMYRVAVSSGAYTLHSGAAIVDVQNPTTPSNPYALKQLVIAGEPSDNAQAVYLSVQPWLTSDLSYAFTIPDTKIVTRTGTYSFYLKAVPADDSYGNMQYYHIGNPAGVTTTPTNIVKTTSGQWGYLYLTANGDPIAKVRVGPDAQAISPTRYVDYVFRARIQATLSSLTADNGTIPVTPAFSPDETAYTAELPEGQEMVAIAATALRSGNAITVNGQAADESGAVYLPVAWDSNNKMTVNVKVGTDSESTESLLTASSTYTLTFSKEQLTETPRISVQPKSATYIDTAESPAALYVRAAATGALSYQWYSSETNSNSGGMPIENATSASYIPEITLVNTREDKTLQQKVAYYYCEVTANSNTVASTAAAVTLLPDPTPYNVRIVTESGEATPANGYDYNTDIYDLVGTGLTRLKVVYESRNESGTWAYSWAPHGLRNAYAEQTYLPSVMQQSNYQVGCTVTHTLNGINYTASSENTIPVKVTATNALAPNIDPNAGPDSASYYTGNTPTPLEVRASSRDGGTLGYQWYRSTDNISYSVIYGATGSTCQPETSDTAGYVSYRCVVTNTVASYNGNTYYANSTSGKAMLRFEAYQRPTINLTGSGTAENPWLITGLTDLQTLQGRVNTDGEVFEDCYFKFDTANSAGIILPADWTPIGTQDAFFSGSVDGDGELLTVAQGGLPLLGYVRHATVKNLNIYGAEIAGYGLVQNYVVDYGVSGTYGQYANSDSTTINIDNVTLKTGTRTLQSGFIGGYASGINYVNISNCSVEEGVVIGYDKQQSDIGSFGGSFNGTVANSVSYATVYGINNVGGLIGEKGQSMGPCRVYNSQFRGTVESTGTYVGGIVGSGYYGNGTAPNTPCVTIQDSLVTGTIKGRDYVGGIFGGEPGCESNWANGAGYVQNNLFTGRVESSGTYVGGIIGYLLSLDRYNIITNNFYSVNCGAGAGIGRIKNVDTSDSHLGRSDAPTGNDADKLTKSVTADELADGTVTAALNSGVNSSGNWTQDGTCPTRGTGKYLRAISVSGYNSRYSTNEVVDFTGMATQAIYSDGSIEPIGSGVSFGGYAQKTIGYQTITAVYSSGGITYSTVFELFITLGSDNTTGETNTDITVYFTLLGDQLHGNTGGTHTLRKGGLTTWISKKDYTLPANSFVIDLFAAVLNENGYSWYNDNVLNGNSGNYIQYIITPEGLQLGEFDNGNRSGWMYTLNGTHPLYGVNEQQLESGDNIVFHYTDDYTVEEGSDKWNNNGASGGATDNIVTPAAKVSNGNASASVTLGDLKDAIANAKSNDGAIVIAPEAAGTVSSMKVNLGKDALSAIGKQTSSDLTIRTPLGNVAIPNAALNSISSQASGSTVTISVETVAKTALSADQQKAVGDASVYDISIISGGKNISSFDGDSIKISIPYTLKDGEDPSGVTVWYLNDAGQLEKMTCTFDKATGLATFKTTHLSKYIVGYSEAWKNPFTDVKAGDWFYGAVEFAVRNGLFNGTADTAFSPNAQMTRAMLVTVLYRMDQAAKTVTAGAAAASGPAVTGGAVATAKPEAQNFTDVKDGQWYTDAVAWAGANGIVTGMGGGLFGTDSNVTREQMAAILYNYANYKGYEVTITAGIENFADAPTVSGWAQTPVKWANGEKLITGRTADTLVPGGGASRAEVATILQRFIEGIAK
jgi:hypothetical protein